MKNLHFSFFSDSLSPFDDLRSWLPPPFPQEDVEASTRSTCEQLPKI